MKNCVTVLEMAKILLEDNFNDEQRTQFRNGFLDRQCHFDIVALGLIDAVF